MTQRQFSGNVEITERPSPLGGSRGQMPEKDKDLSSPSAQQPTASSLACGPRRVLGARHKAHLCWRGATRFAPLYCAFDTRISAGVRDRAFTPVLARGNQPRS